MMINEGWLARCILSHVDNKYSHFISHSKCQSYPEPKKLRKGSKQQNHITLYSSTKWRKNNVHGRNHQGPNDGPSHKILLFNPLLPRLSQLQAPASFDLEVKADIELKMQLDLIYKK